MARKRHALFWAAVVVTLGCGGPEIPSDAAGPGPPTLVQERDALRAELDLSGQDRPYLVLDRASSRLTITLRGNALRDYPILDWQRRRPRVAFNAADSSPAFENTAWTLGRVVPRSRLETREIVPADPASEAEEATASALPPLPEELAPAPSRYAIRFGTSFALEIRAGVDGRRRTTWRDRLEVLTWRAAPGLSVALSPEDAGALYRSLGDDVALVIR